MTLTRRELIKTTAGGALAVAGSMHGASAMSTPMVDFRAVVAVHLDGGHDGWNMAVPVDGRYAAYAAGRGAALALPPDRLLVLDDSGVALHPCFGPLMPALTGAPLGVVVNTGPLCQPIDKSLYRQRPDLSPRNVMLHDDAVGHWRTALAGFGQLRGGNEAKSVSTQARLRVDLRFNGLASGIAHQLHAVARTIELQDHSAEMRPAFAVSHYGYDTHAGQVDASDPLRGRQADLYAELAGALAAFQRAMADLGLDRAVTVFTVSEFGRAYKGNSRQGTDHGWGNNHLVLGGAVSATVRGAYPDPRLGGPDDVTGDGRWLPSLSVQDYLAPIQRWHGGDETAAI